MISLQKPISSYLVSPNLSPRKQRAWQGFRTQLFQIRRQDPHLFERSVVILIIWCAVVGTLQSLPQFRLASTASGWRLATNQAAPFTPTTPRGTSGTLVNAVHASLLPSGPSGQLLPPGTMAPTYTYANNYAHGQCTWYVAGRRQIPSSWGNAASWYYRATSSGWSVGATPAVAAIAWTPAGAFGHVALVEQISPDSKSVYISEMNYRGIGVKSFRWASSTEFKYIY